MQFSLPFVSIELNKSGLVSVLSWRVGSQHSVMGGGLLPASVHHISLTSVSMACTLDARNAMGGKS